MLSERSAMCTGCCSIESSNQRRSNSGVRVDLRQLLVRIRSRRVAKGGAPAIEQLPDLVLDVAERHSAAARANLEHGNRRDFRTDRRSDGGGSTVVPRTARPDGCAHCEAATSPRALGATVDDENSPGPCQPVRQRGNQVNRVDHQVVAKSIFSARCRSPAARIAS